MVFCLFVCFSFFLGPHPQHMEVPRLGMEAELQLPAYTIATAMPEPSQSATYTTSHGNTRSLTHWVRPGIKPAFSGILVGFISAEPQKELHRCGSYSFILFSQKRHHLFYAWTNIPTVIKKIKCIKYSWCRGRFECVCSSDHYLQVLFLITKLGFEWQKVRDCSLQQEPEVNIFQVRWQITHFNNQLGSSHCGSAG